MLVRYTLHKKSVFGVFLVRMRENTDQKNSEYGHFLRSDVFLEQMNPFYLSVAFHIEIGHLICCANQMTDYYMKYNTGLIWVCLFMYLVFYNLFIVD